VPFYFLTPETERIMFEKMAVTFLASMLVLVMTPMALTAQESSLDAQWPETQPVSESAEDVSAAPDSGPVIAALRLSSENAALLAPPAVNLPTAEDLSSDAENVPAAPAAPGKGSGTGLGFMIGGAAALVGGLLIGGTGGNIIAAAGVGLGVYGAIVYF
jgi:hypothetical protein